jgi:hypothetical protein
MPSDSFSHFINKMSHTYFGGGGRGAVSPISVYYSWDRKTCETHRLQHTKVKCIRSMSDLTPISDMDNSGARESNVMART